MGRLDDLVAEVKDPSLRKELGRALIEIKRQQRFGLVFEEHVPETTALLGLPIQVGSLVQRRDSEGSGVCRVTTITGRGTKASLTRIDDGKQEVVATKDLLVIKRFGEPIYPALTSLGTVERGGSKPFHAVINGENFHALQLLTYLYENQVDCIYIDPPYNTGARDWKYNNRYVDVNDVWRHSKWLSFMEKRLRLAKRLLKSDGVLIVTIDEHEVHHLGMLLERVFPEYLRYLITIVINPKGTAKANFSRIEEYAFYVIPDTGTDVIKGRPLGASLDSSIAQAGDEDLREFSKEHGGEEQDDESSTTEGDDTIENSDVWEYRHARRRGTESSYRPQRPNQFYPIYIDEKAKQVVRVGASIPLDASPDFAKVDGLRPIWPIDAESRHRVWRFIPKSMQSLIDEGNVVLGKYNSKRDSWTINYRVLRKVTRKIKTVWWNKAYDAGTHGSELLRKILGEPGLFPFPKSVYTVRDCLAAVVRDRPNALIVDFFAGSGTTLHATCLLNSQDGGTRRTILVTNNEVAQDTSQRLNKQGLFRGDSEYEKHGIFQEVTRPRCEAIIRGKRSDGTPIPGNYLDDTGRARGRPLNLGFEENLESFNLDYLDPDDVDLGRQFEAILPSLWLAAGGRGKRGGPEKSGDFMLPRNSNYGVLFKESRFQKFKEALEKRPDVTHGWFVTDSEEAYAEMRSALPKALSTSMLYRDYLRNFQIRGQ